MITIYYANLRNQFEFKEPLNIVQNYCNKNKDKEFIKCPAWQNLHNNTFGIKSANDFTLSLDDGNFVTNQTQDWFDTNIQIRDSSTISFEKDTFFFTTEDTLLLEQKTAVLEDNDIRNKTHLVEGIFDIGKWVRPLECAIVFPKNDTINVSTDDIIYYVKFHTKQKIKFKKFLIDDRLLQLITLPTITRKGKNISKIKTLSYFYNLINAKKYKKIVFNEIKKNLI